MRDYTKLRAFELADEVAIQIYKITKNFPKEEIFGLTSQMRRAGVSYLQILLKEVTAKAR
jgi:four helix bundle protein